jgi:hypothetical protein
MRAHIATRGHDIILRLAKNPLNFDLATFNDWFTPYVAGHKTGNGHWRKRFTANFPAPFEAWLATNPESNPHAPPGRRTCLSTASRTGSQPQQRHGNRRLGSPPVVAHYPSLANPSTIVSTGGLLHWKLITDRCTPAENPDPTMVLASQTKARWRYGGLLARDRVCQLARYLELG